MTLERVARARDDVRAGLRVGVFDAPLDSAVDQALREGLALLTPHYPLHTVRFTVTEAALTDGIFLSLSAFAPDMQQLVVLSWPLSYGTIKADYTPLDHGQTVLFAQDRAPVVGDEVEIVYRRVLMVTGFDGATATTLSAAWDALWVKAAIYVFVHGEIMRAIEGAERKQAINEVRERNLLPIERRARAELDGMLSVFHAPVRPVSWNRGL